MLSSDASDRSVRRFALGIAIALHDSAVVCYLAAWLFGFLAPWFFWLLGFLASWLLLSWLLGFFLFYVSFGLLPSYAATRLRGYAATRLRGYAATRLRGTRLRGYAATRLRGYASTLSDNPTVNYARVMLTSGGDVDVPVTLRRQRAPSTRDFDLVIATCRHIALDCRRRLSIWSALPSPLSVPYVVAPVGAPPLLYA